MVVFGGPRATAGHQKYSGLLAGSLPLVVSMSAFSPAFSRQHVNIINFIINY